MPAGRAYSVPQTHLNPLAGFQGRTSKGGEWRGYRREKEREGKGREGG